MAGLKIVALIGTPVHLNYFINRIHEEHPIAHVIKENSRAHPIKKVLEKGIISSFKILINQFKNKAKIQSEYNHVLGDKWPNLNPHIPLTVVDNINQDSVKQLLAELKPDVVIVQGTTLIKNKTLAHVPLVINLHWGLSPYYKGSNCTEWAIIKNDIYNIGYTIHKISAQIDGGDIITQGRPQIFETDSANSINMKLTAEGVEALIKVLHKLSQGQQLDFHHQDKNIGQLYLTKHWTGEQQKALKKAEQTMNQVMKNSSTDLYPIIEMK